MWYVYFLRLSNDDVYVGSTNDLKRRFARNLSDLLELLQGLKKNGITIKFVKEDLEFSSDDNPFQQLQMQIIGAVSEFERSMIKARQR